MHFFQILWRLFESFRNNMSYGQLVYYMAVDGIQNILVFGVVDIGKTFFRYSSHNQNER